MRELHVDKTNGRHYLLVDEHSQHTDDHTVCDLVVVDGHGNFKIIDRTPVRDTNLVNTLTRVDL